MAKLRLSRLALAGLILAGLIALAVEMGWLATSFDAVSGGVYESPSWRHWLGTDLFGRDVMIRVLHATSAAVEVALAANAIALGLGFLLGAAAACGGPAADAAVVGLYSVLDNIPGFLLVLAISYLIGSGLPAIALAVGLSSWVPLCRQIRAECARERGVAYLQSAELAGASWPRLLFIHLLPNLRPILYADFAARFAYAVKAEIILSYLGLGAVDRPSWGTIIAAAREELPSGIWWPLLGASAAVFLLVLAASSLAADERREEMLP